MLFLSLSVYQNWLRQIQEEITFSTRYLGISFRKNHKNHNQLISHSKSVFNVYRGKCEARTPPLILEGETKTESLNFFFDENDLVTIPFDHGGKEFIKVFFRQKIPEALVQVFECQRQRKL
jgi:hypothetical protein